MNQLHYESEPGVGGIQPLSLTRHVGEVRSGYSNAAVNVCHIRKKVHELDG